MEAAGPARLLRRMVIGDIPDSFYFWTKKYAAEVAAAYARHSILQLPVGVYPPERTTRAGHGGSEQRCD